MRILKLLIILSFLAVLPGVSQAIPIAAPGTEGLSVIVNSTDDILATYQGNTAAYSNDLYLVNDVGADIFIFNNHSSSVGSTVNLGSFAIGTELVFRLYVNNTGYNFFSGDASRNPDGQAHARVQEEWQTNESLVSFEDLYNGPFVYNDLSFSFTNTSTHNPVPVPSSILLLGFGILGLAGVSRKKTA